MIPLAILRELYDYNYWARDRQLKACAVLTAEQFLRPMESSFSSVRDTLAHLVGTEWVWLERWRGRSGQEILEAGGFSSPEELINRWAEQFSCLTEIEAHWRTVERDMREYLAGLSEEIVAGPLSYVSFAGKIWTYPLWRMLLHVVNHQTYHRGQVTTLLRQLGAQPVQLDFLVAHDVGFRK